MICVREDVEFGSVLQQIGEKLETNSGFLGGGQISLDLGWRELDLASFERLREAITARNVGLAGILSTSLQTRTVAEGLGVKAIIGRLGLAHHQGRLLRQAQRERAEAESSAPVEADLEASAEGEAPTPVPEQVQTETPAVQPPAEREQEGTLYIKRTLRSGQKAMYPGHIVLWGDLNPGAELEAEGDVVVLGVVRGRIHAGCAGNTEAQVWCLALHPTVVRIADCIWNGETRSVPGGKLPANLRISCLKDELKFEPAAGR